MNIIKNYSDLATNVLWGCENYGSKYTPILYAATSLVGIALEENTKHPILKSISKIMQTTTFAMLNVAFASAVFNSGLVSGASLAIPFMIPLFMNTVINKTKKGLEQIKETGNQKTNKKRTVARLKRTVARLQRTVARLERFKSGYSTALKVVNLSISAFAIYPALVYGATVSPLGLAAYGVNLVVNAAVLWKRFA